MQWSTFSVEVHVAWTGVKSEICLLNTGTHLIRLAGTFKMMLPDSPMLDMQYIAADKQTEKADLDTDRNGDWQD